MTDLANLIWTPGFNEDERRTIIDITPRIKFFTIANFNELKLGNHYHEKMPESFYCTDGKIYFKLEDINTKERQEYVIEPGQGITMPLFVAHLVLPDRKSRFIKILGADFDKDDLKEYKITW